MLWKYLQAGWDKDEVADPAEGGDSPVGSQGTQAAHNPSSYPTEAKHWATQPQGLAPVPSSCVTLNRLLVLISVSTPVRRDHHLPPPGLFVGQARKISGHVHPSNVPGHHPPSPNLT